MSSTKHTAASVRPSSKFRRWAFPLLLVLQFLLVLVVVEFGLAWFHPISFRRPIGQIPESAWTQLFHRRSVVPGLNYELNPGQSGDTRGIHVAVNSLGLRDDEIAVEKPAGTRRIAALGDSVTFGWTVPGELSWPNQLESMLNTRDPVRYQVMNFGVGGYSTSDEAVVLRSKALPLDPDLILVAYHPNDPETDPVQPLHQVFHDPEWWEHSNILRLLAWGKRFMEINILGSGEAYRYLHAPGGPHWPSVLKGFDDMKEAASAKGVQVVLVMFPTLSVSDRWDTYPYADLHAQVLESARERGFLVLDLLPVFGSSGRSVKEIAADDEHPNAEGLRIAAEAVLGFIEAHEVDLFRGVR